MVKDKAKEPMLEMYIFETLQLLEQLEQLILTTEKNEEFDGNQINEVFRIMHTIKGSSAMMMFENISTLSHTIEDIFYYIRENTPQSIDYTILTDLIFESLDFIKREIDKINNDLVSDGDSREIIEKLKSFLSTIKKEENIDNSTEKKETEENKQQYYIKQDKQSGTEYQYSYRALIFFEDGCEMENIRAYTVVHNLSEITDQMHYIPENLIEDSNSLENIREKGFLVYLKSNLNYEMMQEFFMQIIFLKKLELIQMEDDSEYLEISDNRLIQTTNIQQTPDKILVPIIKKESPTHETLSNSSIQNIISVNVEKLDKLMDLIGEIVIAEAMVVENPDLKGYEFENFTKAARHLHKITNDLQEIVMSIRMVSLSSTFQKMNRIVRDMSKKLNKDVALNIIGEDTEVDKNIIEHISDPLMHLVRNSIDHGIETTEERLDKGKDRKGTVILEARNAGKDVLINVKDDGRGLDKLKIYEKARQNNLIVNDEAELTDREIFNLILLPGFSTKESVTEFSGRGVGMDVVVKNIEKIGGEINVDSKIDRGTTITLKIPLTLAIIDGMNIKVGNSLYTIPIISIKESFKVKLRQIIEDPEGNEMILVRGNCYPVLRLHKIHHISNSITDLTEGIMIMVEHDDKEICVFADELLGQQQIVVKPLPDLLKDIGIQGIAGCSLMGDGRISLILNIGAFL
ncbi:chemotaxis protein CheA [Mobilitalea sibirica]|uniref:Chemotaxis protein CheA n=1 Tax=Mobilitalea sibirica TaxID=1462919 RepID=A0A8J7HB43_9FIRM|nr:chemotaxis protein CheA [Mobilitalea sibirica]MBH1939577.1 chemotaxis protein CheA [Mobilitalea sibirica]